MSFVVDASIVAAWLLPDESNELAEYARLAMKSEDALAPTCSCMKFAISLSLQKDATALRLTELPASWQGYGKFRSSLSK
jgi:hypothetical protein